MVMGSRFIVPAALLLAVSALVLGLAVWRRRARADSVHGNAGTGGAAGRSSPAGVRGGQPAAAPAATTESDALQRARLEAFRALHAVSFGTAINPSPGGVHEEVAAKVRATLENIAEKPNYAPRRPMQLPKLVQAMNEDEVSRRELTVIIGEDPGLAANLLRLANSPFYRINPEPVESLDRAVALLGIEGMRRLISAALLQPVFRISSGAFEHFGETVWEHTQFAGRSAEAHAAILENSDPFAAQLLSLLTGLGSIVVFRVALDEYLARRVAPHAGNVAALLDEQGASVARQVAASWTLSDRIDQALAEQAPGASAPPASTLGRSLLFGRFLGALAVLHARNLMDEEAVLGTLEQAGLQSGAYQRIWNRLRASPA